MNHSVFEDDVKITESSKEFTLKGDSTEIYTNSFMIKNLHLWNGRKGLFLYTVKTRITINKAVTDEAEENVGLRYFFIDKNKGLYLNRKFYPLRDVSRYQDREGFCLFLSKYMNYIITKTKYRNGNTVYKDTTVEFKKFTVLTSL